MEWPLVATTAICLLFHHGQTSSEGADSVSQLKENLDAAYRKMNNVVAVDGALNFTSATASVILPSGSFLK